jgi:Protein of unknown function (DUF4058)
MPGPFPGVDPYVEAQGLWEGFHQGYTTYCRDALNKLLPDHYVAQLGEHVRLMHLSPEEARQMIPDVLAARERGRSSVRARRARRGAGTALLEPVRVSWMEVEIEVRDVWIEIVRVPEITPVTVIEVLSPTNKVGAGFLEYSQKRRATIHRDVHLVELDLLLRGERLPMDRPLPPGDFYALLSRVDQRPHCDVYSWTLRDPFPPVPIPLLQPDPDVLLDLKPVFAREYEEGRYSRRIDYSLPPSTVKKPADRAWAQQIAEAARPSPRPA